MSVVAIPALIPVAMSYSGTVVPGVGTFHASAAAGGVAANLQKFTTSVGTATKVRACTAHPELVQQRWRLRQ